MLMPLSWLIRLHTLGFTRKQAEHIISVRLAFEAGYYKS